jgi:deoxyadenosine/deoxycytidine kinase
MSTQYPLLRKRRKNRILRIEIAADSMRVGKTTAVKVIAEGFRAKGKMVVESYEDWQHNPYLANSYADPEKNFLDSQKWFIRRKWEQVSVGNQEGGMVDVFIQDVSPEMDYCYAETNRRLGRMSDENFARYNDYFNELDWQRAPQPDLLVYLTVSDGELIRRAMDSRREFETVDPTYFLMMKKVNREWLKQAKDKMDILIVDTDTLNFAVDDVAKSELFRQVIDLL